MTGWMSEESLSISDVIRPLSWWNLGMSIMVTPGSDGRFGEFGGRFVPETLVPACQELEAAFNDAWADPSFRD